jgi:hypothetical protein
MTEQTIALVACSKSKVALPAGQRIAASDLYTGTLFKRASAYARAVCDEWYILSAKHGLVTPGEALALYDRSLYNLSTAERRRWADGIVTRIGTLGLNTPRTHWLIFAGKAYREHVVPRLRGDVEIPLEGLGIGQQIARLDRMLEQLEKDNDGLGH